MSHSVIQDSWLNNYAPRMIAHTNQQPSGPRAFHSAHREGCVVPAHDVQDELVVPRQEIGKRGIEFLDEEKDQQQLAVF